MRCDIIIPVYNAYDAVVECIESVLCCTDLKENGLFIIDDCSTDIRICDYISAVKSNNADLNITVLKNDKNYGFVHTVNIGMKSSKNDVLLLNSDTVVSDGWLEKIKKCAYSGKKTATVTPLSNNATIVSVPNGLKPNEIRDDITLEEYNSLVEKCSYNEYPELPTAHGFCMFIKREAIDTVGFFDEENFGRGYGEENDFSFRCIAYGYRNLLCDDTVVYHKEKQSFSAEREDLSEKHEKILEKRYPNFYKNIDLWCKDFPIEHICKNIDYNLKLNKRKNILFLIHDWETETGGTTLHIKDIISELNGEFNFHILYPKGNRYILHSCFKEGSDSIILPYSSTFLSRNCRYNTEYANMLRSVISALGIVCVHIHHMLGHFFDIADVAEEFGIKTVITLHDYYCFCPKINLLYCNTETCLPIGSKDCALCLSTTGYGRDNIIDTWRSDWYGFLKKMSKIIVPSLDTKQYISSVFKDLDIKVIEHGVNTCENRFIPAKSKIFNVAFVGVMCPHKGSNTVKKLLKLSKSSDIVFHAFGESQVPELFQNRNNYIFHGSYKREDLPELLKENNIALVCFLQNVPETFSYTVSETVAAGVPVLVSDIGAGALRVKQNRLGWVLPSDCDAETVLKTLKEIKEDVLQYDTVLKNIGNYSLKSINDMAHSYSCCYGDTVKNSEINREELKKIIKSCCYVDNDDCYRQKLNEILSSYKWKIINKIRVPKSIASFIKYRIKNYFYKKGK